MPLSKSTYDTFAQNSLTRKRKKENDGSKLALQFYLTSYNRFTCMGVCRHVSAIA